MQALSVFRPLNLFLLAATQLLAFVFLDNSPSFAYLFYPAIWQLVVGTIAVAASGYLINDYFDKERDQINRPGKNGVNFWIENRLLWPVYVSLNIGALSCSYILSAQILMLFSTIIILLFLYSWKLKDLPLLGNLLIAFLAAMSLLIVRHISPNINFRLLLFYAIFAFFISWLREMIKDMEDMHGDKETGSQTLAVILGNQRSNYVVNGLCIFILALLTSSWPLFKDYLLKPGLWIFGVYYIFCLMIPLLWILIEVNLLNRNPDYHKLSFICKYIMATGIASMLFF
jgi:4-hydroxybenzoate polyprenyltransferase